MLVSERYSNEQEEVSAYIRRKIPHFTSFERYKIFICFRWFFSGYHLQIRCFTVSLRVKWIGCQIDIMRGVSFEGLKT